MRFALRKREQKWVVCSGCTLLMEFEDFNEAFAVAWNVAYVLSDTAFRCFTKRS